MNYKIILLFLVSLFVKTISSQSIPSVNDNKAEFTLKWIEKPEYTIDTSEFNDIQVIAEFWKSEIEDEEHPNWLYTLSRDQYPSNFIHSDSSYVFLEQILNSTQNNLHSDDQYELISSTEIQVNNFFGKEFFWKDLKEEEFFRHRVYVIKNCIYQVSVYSRAGQSHNIGIDNFLNSFTIDSNIKGNFQLKKSNYTPTYSIDFPDQAQLTTKVIDSEAGKLLSLIHI